MSHFGTVMMGVITMIRPNSECRYAECHGSFGTASNVIMLSVIMLSFAFSYCYAECHYAEIHIFLLLYCVSLCSLSSIGVQLC